MSSCAPRNKRRSPKVNKVSASARWWRIADDDSRWRDPELTHGCHADRKNGPATSELRDRCAWLHHGSGPEPTGYKVAARLIVPESELPSDRRRDHIDRTAVLRLVKARPGNTAPSGNGVVPADLDDPCARQPCDHVGRDERMGSAEAEQKNGGRSKDKTSPPGYADP